MKKIALVLIILLVSMAMTSFAEGGKTRGDLGDGQVNQVQVRISDEGTPSF